MLLSALSGNGVNYMEKELESIIDATIEKTILSAIEDLCFEIRCEQDPKSIYSKTESVLYKYPLLKKAIEDRKEQIDTIERYGIPHKSKSFTVYNPGSGYVDVRSDYEKKEDMIEQIQAGIVASEERMKPIEKALDQVAGDPYYGIIEMKYFQKKTIEQIAKRFHCDASTVQRHKNELLLAIEFHLFGEDILDEMMGWIPV